MRKSAQKRGGVGYTSQNPPSFYGPVKSILQRKLKGRARGLVRSNSGQWSGPKKKARLRWKNTLAKAQHDSAQAERRREEAEDKEEDVRAREGGMVRTVRDGDLATLPKETLLEMKHVDAWPEMFTHREGKWTAPRCSNQLKLRNLSQYLDHKAESLTQELKRRKVLGRGGRLLTSGTKAELVERVKQTLEGEKKWAAEQRARVAVEESAAHEESARGRALRRGRGENAQRARQHGQE